MVYPPRAPRCVASGGSAAIGMPELSLAAGGFGGHEPCEKRAWRKSPFDRRLRAIATLSGRQTAREQLMTAAAAGAAAGSNASEVPDVDAPVIASVIDAMRNAADEAERRRAPARSHGGGDL